jgi:hypothetical protein
VAGRDLVLGEVAALAERTAERAARASEVLGAHLEVREVKPHLGERKSGRYKTISQAVPRVRDPSCATIIIALNT